MRVTTLGTGDAFGSRGRAQAAYLVEGQGVTCLLDCGPSTLVQMKRFGRDPAAIDFVLLSHLHGDHYGGVPFLVLEYVYQQPRVRPLIVAGPPRTAGRVRRLLSLLFPETAKRPLPFSLQFRTLRPGTALRLGPVEVDSIAAVHQVAEVALALRLRCEGKTLVYSGDSGWTDAFVDFARGADLFICECTFYDNLAAYHMSYRRLAEHLAELRCRRLVLSHLGEEALAHREALQADLAHDGMVVEL